MNKTMSIYRIHEGQERVKISKSSQEREWMDNYNYRFAYKCLPLTIANQHGWVASCHHRISAVWDGGILQTSINMIEDCNQMAGSHFGNGILTFHIDRLIKLPENYNLFITGAPNMFKRGLVPLTGIYEADWAPYSFTMNWKFTEPNQIITFEPGEPFCFFFPILRDDIESFSVEQKPLTDNPQMHHDYFSWSNKRNEFNVNKDRKPQDWQKNYFKGQNWDGKSCPMHNHKTKLDLKE